MAHETGQRLALDHGVEVVVVQGGDDEITAAAVAGAEPVQLGKRYGCEEAGMKVLVVKPGPVELRCGGRPMTVEEPKKTPAAD